MKKTEFINFLRLIVEEVDHEIEERIVVNEAGLTSEDIKNILKREIKQHVEDILTEQAEVNRHELIRENLGIKE